MAQRNVDVELVTEAEHHNEFPGDLFRIAASNLIRNAFQYTVEGRVRILLSQERLEVEDTGKGMSESLLRQVREPMVRGADGEGSGLGVTIVDRIAGRCGWRLEIWSDPGRGTRSTLHFNNSHSE